MKFLLTKRFSFIDNIVILFVMEAFRHQSLLGLLVIPLAVMVVELERRYGVNQK